MDKKQPVDQIVTRYKRHTELNGATPSTGTITCYDGIIVDGKTKEEWEDQFIEITDCHNKVRLHRGSYDDDQAWLMKVHTLRREINEYYDHLIEKMQHA